MADPSVLRPISYGLYTPWSYAIYLSTVFDVLVHLTSFCLNAEGLFGCYTTAFLHCFGVSLCLSCRRLSPNKETRFYADVCTYILFYVTDCKMTMKFKTSLLLYVYI